MSMILTNDKHWLENEYQQACQVPNEIHQHLPVLRQIADTCESVTEFGIALGYSTRAFLSSNASKIRSYDVNIYHTIPELFAAARRAGKDAQFIQASTLATSIEQTDFLFVDSLHTYKQVKQELELHGKHVTKYIIVVIFCWSHRFFFGLTDFQVLSD